MVGNLLQTRRTEVTLVEMAQQGADSSQPETNDGHFNDIISKVIQLDQLNKIYNVEIEELIINEICDRHKVFLSSQSSSLCN